MLTPMNRLRLIHLFLPIIWIGIALPVFGQAADPAAEVESTPTLFDRPDLVSGYFDLINADELAAHLHYFASDYYDGREATSRGQRMAAYYLASQHQRYGLRAAGNTEVTDPNDPQNFFQTFDLQERRLKEMRFAFTREDDTLASSIFTPTRFDGVAYPRYGSDAQATADVIFAGYGIADERLGYNDYAALAEAGIDVTGKWLMVLDDEPLVSAEQSKLPTSDGEPSLWTEQWWQKLVAAAQHGPAAGLIVVADLSPRAEADFHRQVEIAAKTHQGVGDLSMPGTERRGRSSLPPMILISSEAANRALAGTGHTIEQLKGRIDSTLEPTVLPLEGVRAHGLIESETRLVETENVIGYIEGSDPLLKDEVVVILAHYDHEGFVFGSDGEKVIYNGADDNGSGTIGVLKTARAFANAALEGYRPRRSVLFLHVTAEEKGLLGSAYYTDVEPYFPLENTVAALNMDMIGRFDPTHPTGSENYVYIIGSYLISQDLHGINVRANEITGINLELDERFNDPADPNQFYRRSDQWNFGKHGIPFIFFFTGTHEDYHQPGDEPHKIEYDRMERIVRLVFATAWQLANQDERPEVTGRGFN